MHHQPIFDIAALCVKKNINQVILCPGSRCAPLTLAFTRHPVIKTRTFSDERSAGFIALGIAQRLNQPVAMVCTSGTAAYNFAPAVAEAFFSQTPLIIFTADRPAEWIAQHDGQTIHQSNIFGNHVKKSYTLPQDYDHHDSQWAINRIVNEAINLARQEPQGPVHINAPFREPLYPAKNEVTGYTDSIRIIEDHQQQFSLTDAQQERIRNEWRDFNRILIVAAQHEYDSALISTLSSFAKKNHIPIVTDIISNLHAVQMAICHSDLFLGQASDDLKKSLRPDLLITFGKSLISKNLKLFLRKYSPKAHWHVQPNGIVADTFKNLTDIFYAEEHSFFEFLNTLHTNDTFGHQKQSNYTGLWEIEERRALRCLREYFPQKDLSELEFVQEVIHNLPAQCSLHLANSMSVRYANFIGLNEHQQGVKVYANRGTSGIDGCTSTAVGHALSTDEPNILITGDLAFFYDRNAFWHNYNTPNLRIVVLNNHGGSIFNMIDGPASQPEAAEYFITQQKLNAKKLCEEFGFDHLLVDNRRKVKNLIKDFFEFDGKMKIIEFESDTHLNRTIFDNLKLKIKQSYES
jgi:2-succinyl-5-enolpyruvyl-6-hydroxy-3-cyclohexene-1-carboxylate synthase